MNASLQEARKTETAFLTAVAGRFDAGRRWLPGSTFRATQGSERDRLRQMMASRGMHESDLLDRLPNNRRRMLSGYERPWYWFGRKKVSAITASVLSPLAGALDVAKAEGAGRRSVQRLPTDVLAGSAGSRRQLAGPADNAVAHSPDDESPPTSAAIGGGNGVCDVGAADALGAVVVRPGVAVVELDFDVVDDGAVEDDPVDDSAGDPDDDAVAGACGLLW